MDRGQFVTYCATAVPYAVKEVYYTLQGEDGQAGRAAVFLRFAGCNLWSGRERDRPGAVCRFCDTDFVGTDGPGGGKFPDAAGLAAHIMDFWPGGGQPLVVCTGGEPALQLDAELVQALHGAGFEVAIETNGTLPLAPGIDWVCVSPKAGTRLVVRRGQEIKLVFPQSEPEARPERFAELDFEHHFLQPLDAGDAEQTRANTAACVEYCLRHPRWRLSVQVHKVVGID